jgi:hypothetical protein
MGYELNQLMKQYGLTTRTMSPYSGVSTPTTLAADATADQRKKFNEDSAAYVAQRGAYDSYKNEYQNRIANTSPYQNSPLFKGQKQNWDTTLTTPTYSSTSVPQYTGANTPTFADEWVQYGDPANRAWKNTRNNNLTYGEKPYVNTPVSGAEDMAYGNRKGVIDPNFKVSGSTTGTTVNTTDTTKKADGTAAGHYENQITGYMDSSSTDADGNVIQGDPIYGQVWVPGLAHGGPVRHFYGGGQNKIDGGIGDLVDRYDLANPTELPVTYAAADTGTRTDAAPASAAQRTVGGVVSPPSGTVELTDDQLRKFQANAVAAGAAPNQRGPAGPVEGAPVRTEPAGGATLAPAAAPVATGSPSLQTLYEKYISKQPKSTEMTAAEQKYAAKNDALISLLKEQASKTEENAPSKAEMYFRLAAALANPTKSRGFAGVMENVGAAAKELAEFQKSTTDAKRAAAAAKLQLLLKTGEIDAQQAKEELDKLRAEDKEVRGVAQTFAMKEFETEAKKNEPQSALAKEVMERTGLKPGTPGHQAEMTRINKLNEAKDAQALEKTGLEIKKAAKAGNELSRDEWKASEELDKSITDGTQALADLKEAFVRNNNSYDASTLGTFKRRALELANSQDEKLLNTQAVERLMGTETLSRLKSTFGGQPSNAEGKLLKEYSGLAAQNTTARKEALARAIMITEDRIAKNQAKLKNILEGRMKTIVETGSGKGQD